jgi:PAS domain-containing protein
MVWTAPPGGLRDFVNRRWLEYTGLSSEQAVGTGLVAVHPEDLPESIAQWEQAVRAGTPMEHKIRPRRGLLAESRLIIRNPCDRLSWSSTRQRFVED